MQPVLDALEQYNRDELLTLSGPSLAGTSDAECRDDSGGTERQHGARSLHDRNRSTVVARRIAERRLPARRRLSGWHAWAKQAADTRSTVPHFSRSAVGSEPTAGESPESVGPPAGRIAANVWAFPSGPTPARWPPPASPRSSLVLARSHKRIPRTSGSTSISCIARSRSSRISASADRRPSA